jgi:hypothetical protein
MNKTLRGNKPFSEIFSISGGCDIKSLYCFQL